MANAVISDLGITLHVRWYVATQDAPISAEASERMPTYITRYAQTLGVNVRAVGGADNHLHLLLDMPGNRTLDAITAELQRATGRFLQDVLGSRTFAWEPAYFAESVGAADRDFLTEYVAQNRRHHESGGTIPEWEAAESDRSDDQQPEAMPEWLRKAMP